MLKTATAPIEATVIRDIPFRNASEAVTIILSQVKAVTKWPAVLESERFAAEKKDFEEIVDKALTEDEEGDISADTLKRAHDLVHGLRSKLRRRLSTGPRLIRKHRNFSRRSLA